MNSPKTKIQQITILGLKWEQNKAKKSQNIAMKKWFYFSPCLDCYPFFLSMNVEQKGKEWQKPHQRDII